MNSKTYAIGILTVTAVVLFLAQFIPLSTARAADVIKDRDYSMATARAVVGGETLYMADNRLGMIAAFVWDPGRREIVVRDVRPLADAFGQ